MKIEEEVREKVDALLEKYERATLALHRRESTDAAYLEVYEGVAKELTRMAILGTLPAGSRRHPGRIRFNHQDI
jgi:hypothetical protein